MKFQLTLRKRLVLLVATALVPLFGLSLINAQLNATAAVSRATDNLKFAASMVAANQNRLADSAYQVLLSIVNAPGLVEGKTTDCHRYLKTLREQLFIYGNLGLIGLDGYFRCHSLNDGLIPYAGDRAFFKQTLASRGFVAGEYFMGRALGKPVLPFAMPVMNSAGNVSAVAFVSMDLNEMSKAIAALPLPPGSRLVITDRQGVVLAVNPQKSSMVGKQVPSPVLQEAVKTMRAGIAESPDPQGRTRIYSFLPSRKSADSPFFVAVSADREAVLAPVYKQLRFEFAALTLLALLSGWLAWMLGGRAIVKPAAAILDATRQLQQGLLDVRIPTELMHEGGEFAQIAAGFNLMAQSLQAQQGALEAELTRSQAIQEKLHDAQRLARIGYWQIDLATELIWWSDEIYDWFDIDRALFDGTYDSFLQWVHPGDREAFKATRDSAVRTGSSLESEFRVITPAGNVRWIHQFGRVQEGDKDAPSTRRTGVVQDITERKNVELAMARGTELLNRTGALAKVGGWELVIDTMALYCSEEIYRIYELDPLVSLTLEQAVNFLEPDGQSIVREAAMAALGNMTPWDVELPLTTATGRRIWVRIQGHGLLRDGQVVRLVGVLQDITEQHKAQENLRLLETCISRLNDIVIITEAEPITDEGLRIVFVNDAFERRTGYSREEVVGKNPRILQGPKTQRAELDQIHAALKTWQPVRVELINYTKSGEEFWLELDIVPVSDSKGSFTHWVEVARDITRRKHAETALIDSEQRYAALFETAPVPMWVYDIATTRYLAVNHAAIQAYGYSAAEFLSMTIFDIRPEAEHEHLRQWLGNSARTTARWKDRRKDGSIFPVETVSEVIQYAGQAARFVVAVDKTSQVNAEKDVQDYLFTLQRSADAAQAITWHQTLEGTMQEIAEQARGVVGTHQAIVTLSGNSNHLKMHAMSLSEKYASYDSLMEPSDGNGIYAMVCENNRSIRLTQAELEAHPRWQGLSSPSDSHPALRGWLAMPLTGRNGANIGLLQLSDKYEGEFTKQDEYVALELGQLASAAIENSQLLEEVSRLNAGLEQKVAERTVALARQEALFRALSEQAPQMVWTASPDGAATYFNRAWFELMGGELEDWTGYQWLAAVHPEDVADLKANWKIARATRSSYAGIRRLLVKDGSCRTMAYRASPVFDDHNEVAFWVGIDADITEIKGIEAALRLSNQELEAFSYSVSHDLRSPLNTVDGFSRLLAKQLAPQLSSAGGEKVKHYLSRIQAGVAQMGQLIEDLLSLSQVARAQLRTEPVDLSVMARSLLEEWQARQPERQVAVHIESGLQAEADGPLVRIVMENLLNNAWKFTSQKAHAEIRMGQKFDAAGLPVFFVQDNGAGFDMAYADKLFDPFQRLHAASEFSGTGIGLATVSRVIKRHGGRIWAESAPDCGTTFFFTLRPVRRVV